MSKFNIEKESYVVLAELTKEQHGAFYNCAVDSGHNKYEELFEYDSFPHIVVDSEGDIMYSGYTEDKNITQEFLAYYNTLNSAPTITPDNLVESLQQGDVVKFNDDDIYDMIMFEDCLMNGAGWLGLGEIDPPCITSIKRGEDIIYNATKALPDMSKDTVAALEAFKEYLGAELGYTKCQEQFDDYLKQFNIID